MPEKFIDVYAKRSGVKHRVPEHFMTVPAIARHFTLTPRQRAREAGERRTERKPAVTRDVTPLAPPAGEKKE